MSINTYAVDTHLISSIQTPDSTTTMTSSQHAIDIEMTEASQQQHDMSDTTQEHDHDTYTSIAVVSPVDDTISPSSDSPQKSPSDPMSFSSSADMNQHMLRLGTFTTLVADSPPTTPEPVWKVYTALISTQFLWVGFHLLARYSFDYIHPFVFPTLRAGIAVPFLFGAAWHNDRASFRSISRRDMKLLALLGLLGVTLNQNLFNLGLRLSSAGDAGLMQPATPVFTMVFAVILKRERAHWLKFVGLASAVVGSFVIVAAETWLAPYLGSIVGGPVDENPTGTTTSTGASGSTGDTSAPSDAHGVDSSSPHRALGMLFFMIQTLCFSLYMTIQKPILQRIPPMTVTFFTFLFGLCGNFIVSVGFLDQVKWTEVPWEAWLSVMYTAIFAACIAFSFFSYATKHLPASIASLAVMLQPAVGPICGALLLHEKLTILHLVGGLFILLGLILVVHQRKRENKIAELEARVTNMQKEEPHSDTELYGDGNDEAEAEEDGQHGGQDGATRHSPSHQHHRTDSNHIHQLARHTPTPPLTSWDDLPRPILKHSGSLNSNCSRQGLHVHFIDVDDITLEAERHQDEVEFEQREEERRTWEQRRRERDAELQAQLEAEAAQAQAQQDVYGELERSLNLLDENEEQEQTQDGEYEEVEEEVEVEVEVDEDEETQADTSITRLMTGRASHVPLYHSHILSSIPAAAAAAAAGSIPSTPARRYSSPPIPIRSVGDHSPLSTSRPSSADPHEAWDESHSRYAYVHVAPSRRAAPRATYVA